MGISITTKGNWDQTATYLRRLQALKFSGELDKYGRQGVVALAAATPVDKAVTANSWIYEIVNRRGYLSIRWRNTHVNDGQVIAVLLQYGHATKNGGYVQGRDYINPAIQPIFDQITEELWREVTR